jgi:phosphatidate cytidylyltransferase
VDAPLNASRSESPLATRVATVAGLVALVLIVLRVAPAAVFNAGIVAVVVLATAELYRLPVVAQRTRTYRALGLVGAGAVAAAMAALPPAASLATVAGFLMALLSAVVFLTRRPSVDEFHEIVFVLFGGLYVSSTLGQLAMIRRLALGRDLATAVIVTVLAREVVAHFAGRLGPRGTPVNDSINANKSVAGAAIGVIGAIAAAIMFARIVPAAFTAWRALAFGALVGTACQFGDLAESYVKRVAGRRHSSAALGAEGGVLDFVDAAAFAAATAHPLLLWWGY